MQTLRVISDEKYMKAKQLGVWDESPVNNEQTEEEKTQIGGGSNIEGKEHKKKKKPSKKSG